MPLVTNLSYRTRENASSTLFQASQMHERATKQFCLMSSLRRHLLQGGARPQNDHETLRLLVRQRKRDIFRQCYHPERSRGELAKDQISGSRLLRVFGGRQESLPQKVRARPRQVSFCQERGVSTHPGGFLNDTGAVDTGKSSTCTPAGSCFGTTSLISANNRLLFINEYSGALA